MTEESFLKQCGGFTPAPDVLTKNKKYGFEGAHVWGVVWRYYQNPDKSKPPSHEAMAKRAGMSRRTFIEYLNLLIEDGYIEDMNPGVRNCPHLYNTDKGEELIKRGMQISHTDSVIQDDRYAELAQDNNVGMRNLHTEYAEVAHPGMQDLHLIDSKEIQVKDIKESASKPTRPPAIPAMAIFFEITGYFKITKFWQAEAGRIVGDNPADLEFWRKVVIGWTGKYPTVHNIEGMLDFFKRREIPGQHNGAKNGTTILERPEGSKPEPTGTAAALGAALRARARPSSA